MFLSLSTIVKSLNFALVKLEFANGPLKVWIIDPVVHGLLDGPSDVMCLPLHYGKNVHTDAMSRGVTMVIDGWKGPRDVLSAFTQMSLQTPLFISSHNLLDHTCTCRLPHFDEWYYPYPLGPPGSS